MINCSNKIQNVDNGIHLCRSVASPQEELYKTVVRRKIQLPQYMIVTHFETTHSFCDIVEVLKKFPHTSLDIHPLETSLCGVSWDDNNNWARFNVTLYVNSSSCSPDILEFNHTYGQSDIWIMMFRSLRHQFQCSSLMDGLELRELSSLWPLWPLWPENYDDSNVEFFNMVISLTDSPYLESYTLGAIYLADFVKKTSAQLLINYQTLIESATLKLLSTNHPQCVRCVAQIAEFLDFPTLMTEICLWHPPDFIDELIWRDPIRKILQLNKL
jgi:hypothetical protein